MRTGTTSQIVRLIVGTLFKECAEIDRWLTVLLLYVGVGVCVYMYIAIIMCEGEHWSVAKLLCVLLIVIAVVHALE